MAGSKAITSATTAIFINASTPTTYDSSGFGALSGWVQIGEVTSYGTFGGKTKVITHIPVDTATEVKRGGSQSFGALSLTLARHTGSDTTALNAAFADRQPRAFKIVYPSALGVVDYCTAIVASVETNIGGADNILQSNVSIELDNSIITV
jgi:hypothetical protein